jgi:hypothetical protein
MKLPNDCSFAAISQADLVVNDIDCPNCCRTVRPVSLPKAEQPLCRSRRTENEAYRFFWSSSFNGDGLVHVGRSNDVVTLRWQYLKLRVPFPTDSPPVMRLPLSDWERLQHAISTVNFWSLNRGPELPGGLDGAQWTIEGRRDNDYHAVHRWSPRGAIYDLGRLFFALVGPPLAAFDLY